jgi:hypothetical protein
MKSILNPKTVAWVYVGLGLFILIVQFYKTISGAPFDWIRCLPGAIFITIGIVRLVRLTPNN